MSSEIAAAREARAHVFVALPMVFETWERRLSSAGRSGLGTFVCLALRDRASRAARSAP